MGLQAQWIYNLILDFNVAGKKVSVSGKASNEIRVGSTKNGEHRLMEVRLSW